jgi:hypothetical protein
MIVWSLRRPFCVVVALAAVVVVAEGVRAECSAPQQALYPHIAVFTANAASLPAVLGDKLIGAADSVGGGDSPGAGGAQTGRFFSGSGSCPAANNTFPNNNTKNTPTTFFALSVAPGSTDRRRPPSAPVPRNSKCETGEPGCPVRANGSLRVLSVEDQNAAHQQAAANRRTGCFCA